MSLLDDFRQNRIPKVFSEKIAIFMRRVPVKNVKTLKTWLLVFSASVNLKNLKFHHIDYDRNMSLWDDFSQNRRPKFISEKRAIFPRRGAGKTCETLKTWLWVFSAIDILRNVKLHDIDYGPNMSLWDASVKIEDQNIKNSQFMSYWTFWVQILNLSSVLFFNVIWVCSIFYVWRNLQI